MTVNECAKRDQRMREKILTIFAADEVIRDHIENIAVQIEDAIIVIRGRVPSNRLLDRLVPAVRRAGVLGQVTLQVRVAS